MAFAAIRFIAKGWIQDLYLNNSFQFHYYGFHWVQKPKEIVFYCLLFLTFASAVFVALGFYYRIEAIIYFLTFTYVELIDKTYYLNHYYFISLMSFMMIFIPANQFISFDAIRKPEIRSQTIQNIFPCMIKLQIIIVYVFAGIAKINYDWLLEAMPLSIWLSSRAGLPVIGTILDWEFMPYLMSCLGMFFDLLIPFLLMWNKSRKWAYICLVLFHVFTWLLFPIGMFPWIMIFSTLIFFERKQWQALLLLCKINLAPMKLQTVPKLSKSLASRFMLFIIIQLVLPMRQYFYEGSSSWNEKGFRYAWNVMRVEKSAYVEFNCYDPEKDIHWKADPSQYLSNIQEHYMSFQPDMILEFAHFLEARTKRDIKVFAHCWVSINGRVAKRLIDHSVDLTQEQDSLFGDYSWVYCKAN